MEIVKQIEKALGAVLRWVCVILFAALVLLVTYQVLQRQVLIPIGLMKHGFPWTTAAGSACFIWLGLLGAAYVIGENDDVAIDFLVRKFRPIVARVVECLAHSVVGFFAVWVMIYGGFRFVAATWDQTVELLPITEGQLYSVLVISGALIAIYSVLHIIETLNREIVVKNEEDIDISTVQEDVI